MLVSTSIYAATKAVTDEGSIVVLHSDGTWEYESRSPNTSDEIETNNRKFTRSSDNTFQVKSKKTDVVAWINPQKWIFKKATSNPEAEYEFQLKGEDLYGMMVSEGIEISPESLTQIAFENAKNVAPDIKIIKRERRNINGEDVIYMEMQGSTQGIYFTYLGYYFSNEKGTTQLIAYTATKLVTKYKKEIEGFLNGLSTDT